MGGTSTGARLIWIRPQTLFHIVGSVYQIVPSGAVDSLPDGEIIALDPERLIRFSPPKKWAKDIKSIRLGLPMLWASQHEWMSNQIPPNSFKEDFAKVNRNYHLHMAKLTASIGWNARGLLHKEMSGFHQDLRELRWRHFCIEIRDEILHQLGAIFKIIGRLRGESPILRWDRMLNSKKVDEEFFNLMAGRANT